MRKSYVLTVGLLLCSFGLRAEYMPYTDKNLTAEQRADDLLSRMTLHEKVLQLQNNSNGDTDRIPENYRESTGSVHEMNKGVRETAEYYRTLQNHLRENTPHGIPALTSVEGINGVLQEGCTIFPQEIAQGSTFNPELIGLMGEAIGREAYSMGIRQLLCPVLDIARELRWGRVEETYGEDPFLIGEMGTAFVKGTQSRGVGAMPKHFVAHGTPTGGLNCAHVSGGERELRNLYAYPFAKVFRNASPISVMGCYSAYDGVPMAHSAYYMTKFLRDDLGFDGFVYSDWGSVDRLKSFHHATSSSEEAARKALMAGIDMDVWDWAYSTLEDQVKQGLLDEKYIDRACRRVLIAKFKLGLFDEGEINPDDAERTVRSAEHVALSKAIADESIVLLENHNNILPLNPDNLKSVALLGPNSNVGIAGDYGWINASDRECVTLAEGLAKALGSKVKINQADGCDWWSQDDSNIQKAAEIARNSDVAIVAVGTRSVWLGRNAKSEKVTSGEGFDLSSLELPGRQLDLLKAVKETGTPMIVVLITGKPLVMTWAKENADAVVLQFYGGEQQGNALAEMLTGKVNPSGHLNVSFPRSTGNTPCYYNYYPTDRETVFDVGGTYDEPSGHYVFEKPYALWNFGRGLSYTEFEYGDMQLNDSVYCAGDTIKASIKVRNTGHRDGKEVVQLYVHDLVTSVSMPVQQLKAFKKVEIPAGKEVEVELEIPVDELAFVNEFMERVVEPGEVELQVGRASDDIRSRKLVNVK